MDVQTLLLVALAFAFGGILKGATGAGALGAGLGTVALAGLSAELLTAGVALVVFLYVGFRLMKPHWQLPHGVAARIVLPVGIFAGFLQGASGVSAPVSITFLNAMKLERGQFISTISVFFVAMALVQLPVQVSYNIMTMERLLYSSLALIPLALFMPVGSYLGKRMSRKTFDSIILSLLTLLAVKLMFDALS